MIAYYVVIAIFFAILFGIGIVASRRITNLSDYYVGGKNLGYWVVAFSARATGESAWLLLGLTGMGAAVGLSALWVVVGEVLGVSIAWFFMAERFKQRTDEYQSITVPDYLVSHFKEHGKLIRMVSAGAIAVFVTIYVSAQIDATGKAFETFLGWKQTFADWGPNAGYYIGALAGFGIVLMYTFTGGFVAVAWSDLFQGLLMVLGLVALPIAALLAIPEGISWWDTLGKVDPSLTNIMGKHGFSALGIAGLIGFLAIGLGFLGSPQVFVRFISVKNLDEIKKGRIVAIAFTILTDVGAVMIGMIGRSLLAPVENVEGVMGPGAEQVLPMLVKHVFPAIIVGVYIAAVLSAIMSTVDSLLVLASSAATRDFYQQTFHPNMKGETLTNLSRWVTLGLATFALAVALLVAASTPDRTIFWFVIFGWSGIAATFCPVIILSLFWRGYNAIGALTSMITGFLCVPLFKFVVPMISGGAAYFGKVEELFPSFLVAMTAGAIASKLSSRQQKT